MLMRMRSLAYCALVGKVAALNALFAGEGSVDAQDVIDIDPAMMMRACPDYKNYAAHKHAPYSTGPLEVPFQRPSVHCRTFQSDAVEDLIDSITSRMVDKDLARIFENAFPNTLDTTVRWHVDADKNKIKSGEQWDGAQSFIVTGDINAEWLRDSTNQLAQYQKLAKKDKKIESLILGAINTQAEFVLQSPYCNAFQPPPPSRLGVVANGQDDVVHPAYEPTVVFECKYELDSLAHFLRLGNQFYDSTGSIAFLGKRWYNAIESVLEVIRQQSKPTFDGDKFAKNEYTFRRRTDAGTETLNLNGVGNPLNAGTGLVRSAFRPSDDATILGYLIPANAMMATELKKAAAMLESAGTAPALAKDMADTAAIIEKGVWEHGVVTHKVFGEVFAFEVDGYGSSIMMDDANLPSLLALPLLGFVDVDNKVYQNTRKMILSKQGNPYYLTGKYMHGVGGPHIGLENAWPMSLLVQAMTSDSDTEITACLTTVRDVSSRLGLVHESVHVAFAGEYTRSWFAWANSVFAQTILDLVERKPHLLFGDGTGVGAKEDKAGKAPAKPKSDANVKGTAVKEADLPAGFKHGNAEGPPAAAAAAAAAAVPPVEEEELAVDVDVVDD